MRIHVLGICGTFMGGVAALAKAAGHQVTGSDENVYPPMSTQLRKLGIKLDQGYSDVDFSENPDCVLVGNVLSRGNPAVERLLRTGLPYYSGAEWLLHNVLEGRWVIAVSGTHGKTTTASMLAWILEYAGLAPGFLIGGVPNNFGVSAELGKSKYFVVEADEYDTAFFDKRAKFVHYRPRTLVINNIEYDHADIYPDMEAILWQFHQLLRTVPDDGLVTVRSGDEHVDELLDRGVWTAVETFGTEDRQASTWHAAYDLVGAKSSFTVHNRGEVVGSADWALTGTHNLENALAAISAASHVGVRPAIALEALTEFGGVKRRLDKRGTFGGITLYEDFAHHPTAIRRTLAGLAERMQRGRILAVVEPRSNTMRLGVHEEALNGAFDHADKVHFLAPPELDWRPREALAKLESKLDVAETVEELVDQVMSDCRSGDQIVLMSNGSFGGLPRLMQQALKAAANG